MAICRDQLFELRLTGFEMARSGRELCGNGGGDAAGKRGTGAGRSVEGAPSRQTMMTMRPRQFSRGAGPTRGGSYIDSEITEDDFAGNREGKYRGGNSEW